MSVVEIFFGGTLALACLVGMVSDARRRLIPNVLSGSLLLVGLIFGYLQGGFVELGWHAAHAGVALLIGMVLFAIGWFGGGDGKFYAACAAWFPVQLGMTLGLAISLAGLVLALAFIVWRSLRGQPTLIMSKDKSAQLPFGIAIGLGTLATFALRL